MSKCQLRVIAEGVETEQRHGVLHGNGCGCGCGCDEMQDYLFRPALPPEAQARQVAGAPLLKVLAAPGLRLVA